MRNQVIIGSHSVPTKAWTGTREILLSGFAMASNDKPLKILVSDIYFLFKFEADAGNARTETHPNPETNTCTIKLFNSNDGMESASAITQPIAIIGGINLYLEFTHILIGDGRRINYVFSAENPNE